jgi:serine phosphatase RsbU (regulator of sigma subunit)
MPFLLTMVQQQAEQIEKLQSELSKQKTAYERLEKEMSAQESIFTQIYELHEALELKNKEIKEQSQRLYLLNEEMLAQNEEISQQNEEIMAQRDALEASSSIISKKNDDINASINYAKRIQTAMLPTPQKIQEALPKHFIYFMPKDVVSGDFYWFSHKNENGNPISILAAVDCTGHGIPGAFMSLIGDASLNQIVHDKEIHRPDLILREMHHNIQTALNQTENNVRDGMDMAIVCIDHKNGLLQYAGAMNPIYYIQNEVFTEIKADKKPIGGGTEIADKVFTLHTISLETPLTFYLCSDGYQDQFGGKDNRKFMVKRLKELLFAIHSLPMPEQHLMLSETMLEWTRNGRDPQTDDILIIGVALEAVDIKI